MKNYSTNKTTIKTIDWTWSSDLLDMNDYRIKKRLQIDFSSNR